MTLPARAGSTVRAGMPIGVRVMLPAAASTATLPWQNHDED